MISTRPIAHLNLLGGATLEGDQGPISGRGAQRRRIALLAILAGIRRPVSRDKVMGLLWEESDEERARKLISESLYVIRKAIGEDGLITTGSDIRLNPDVVWCDVVEFHAAIERGDDAAAVGLYSGPFLDGFFISDAPEFEKWLDGTRDTLGRTYATALCRLAETSEKNGELLPAVAWWRKLADHDASNATYAVGLMRALDRTGQRAAALQHARAHAALLKSEFDADPDPSVTALARQLKEVQESAPPIATNAPHAPEPLQPQAPQPDAAEYVSVASPPPARSAPSTQPEPPLVLRVPRRGHRLRIAASFAVIAAIVITVVLAHFNQHALAPAKTVRIAIFPFDVRGGADPDWRAGMVDILTHDLDGAGALRPVDSYELLNDIAAASADISPGEARSIARRHDAEYYLRGAVSQVGPNLVLSANLYRTGDDTVQQLVSASGDPANPMVLIDQIATQLLTKLGVDPNDFTRAAATLTASVPALNAWMTGENFYRQAKYREAVSSFETAVAADQTFALADYRLSAAAEWNFDFELAQKAAQRASDNSIRLPQRLSPLLHAWLDFLEGNATQARQEYDKILVEDPDDIEANSGLGEVLMHLNPMQGMSSDSARVVFDRVSAVAPVYGEVRFHAMEFAVRDNKLARFDTLFTTLDASNSQYRAWQAVRAFTWGTSAEQSLALSRLKDPTEIGIASGRVAALSHNFVGARLIADKFTNQSMATWRAGGHIIRAELFLADGRIAEARRELDAVGTDEKDWTREIESLLVLHPLANSTADDLQKQRSKLLAWDPGDHTPNGAFFFRVHALDHKRIRWYLLGLLSAKLQDYGAAADYQRKIDAEGVTSEKANAAFGYALSQSLNGHVLLAQGKKSDALTQLMQATIDASPPKVALSPFYSRAYDRYVIARINEELGRTDEARRWYKSLLEGFDFMYVGAARQRLIALH